MGNFLSQKEDGLIEVTITEDDEVTPVVIAAMTQLYIFAYQKPDTLIDKFSLNATTGYGTITVVDNLAGKVKIYIGRSKTNTAFLKDLYLEVVGYVADPLAEGGELHCIDRDIPVTPVVGSISKNYL